MYRPVLPVWRDPITQNLIKMRELGTKQEEGGLLEEKGSKIKKCAVNNGKSGLQKYCYSPTPFS